MRKIIHVGDVYHTSAMGKGKGIIDGKPYEVLEQVNYTMWRIRFLETGYECVRHRKNIIAGHVKDPYNKYVCNGVACVGIADTVKTYANRKLYGIWHAMISRCYNPLYASYKFNHAQGVKICERWKCFEYYVQDFYKIPKHDLIIVPRSKYILAIRDRYNLLQKDLEYRLDNVEVISKKEYQSMASKYYKNQQCNIMIDNQI